MKLLSRFGLPAVHLGLKAHDPLWGTLNTRCRIVIGIQKGTMILTITHVGAEVDEDRQQ